jgi:hypothetical protein
MSHLTHALTLQVFKVEYGTGSSSGESGYESEAEITAVLRRLPLTADKKLFLASKVLHIPSFLTARNSCIAHLISSFIRSVFKETIQRSGSPE